MPGIDEDNPGWTDEQLAELKVEDMDWEDLAAVKRAHHAVIDAEAEAKAPKPKVWVSISTEDGVTISGLPLDDVTDMATRLKYLGNEKLRRLGEVLLNALKVQEVVSSTKAHTSYVNFGVEWP